MSIGQWYVYGLHGLRLWIVSNYYFIIIWVKLLKSNGTPEAKQKSKKRASPTVP